MARAKTVKDLFLRLAVAAHNYKTHGKQKDRDQLAAALDTAFAYLDPKDLQDQRPTEAAKREAEAVRTAEDAEARQAEQTRKTLNAAAEALEAARAEARTQEARALRLVDYARAALISARQRGKAGDWAAAWAALSEADQYAIDGGTVLGTGKAADLAGTPCHGGRALCGKAGTCTRTDKPELCRQRAETFKAETEAARRAAVLKRAGHTACHVLAAGLPAGLCAGRHTCTTGPADCPGRGGSGIIQREDKTRRRALPYTGTGF